MKLRDIACHCGWKFPGFHVCADLSTPEPTLSVLEKRKPRRSNAPKAERGSEQWKSNISEARAGRTTGRDSKIVKLYSENFTMREVGLELGIDHRVVSRVLKKAEALGQIKVRPRGPARTSTRKRSGRD